ncbi:MAG: hypothetical protein JW954_07230 [Dehalococcoidaceae bacterium]|nr:hypothetical protein [Dehalococcoidaceae bacterium]
MRTLKIISLITLSFILFVSLNSLAVAITLDRTVLNPKFVTSQIDHLEISAMLEEIITSEQGSELPRHVKEAIAGAVVSMEPQVKTQANHIIRAIYDYIKGRKDNPDLAEVFKSTLFGTEFLSAFIDSLNIPDLAGGIFEESLQDAAPDDLEVSGNLPGATEKALEENEESLKEQLRHVAEEIADYILGETQQFTIEIDAYAFLDSLRAHLHSSFMNSPPGYLNGEPEAAIEQEFNRLFGVFLAGLPMSLEIDQTVIGEDAPAQMAETIEKIESGLGRARSFASTFQMIFVINFVVAVLLVAGIALIYREPIGTMLNLGIVVLITAFVTLVAGFTARNITQKFIVEAQETPVQIQAWLSHLAGGAFLPLITTGFVYLVAGIVLLLIFVLLQRRMQA